MLFILLEILRNMLKNRNIKRDRTARRQRERKKIEELARQGIIDPDLLIKEKRRSPLKAKDRPDAEYPYTGYKVYGPMLDIEAGRFVVQLKKDKKFVHMNYSRYLMSIKEGRILDTSEKVDHIDENKLNDDINNLQILSDVENIRKSALGRWMITIECPVCSKEFTRLRKKTFVGDKYKSFSCCSVSCGLTFSKLIKEKGVFSEEIKNKIKNSVIRQFNETGNNHPNQYGTLEEFDNRKLEIK